jgi:hypothetical protein
MDQGSHSGQSAPPNRAVCQQHGLHYDPTTQAGCVLCRRSAPPPPAYGQYGQPQAFPQAPPQAKRSSGVILFVVLGVIGFFFLMVTAIGYFGFTAYREAKRASLAQSGSKSAGTLHTSSDGAVKLWASSLWHERTIEPGEESKLSLLSSADNIVINVINESATDFEADFDVNRYAETLQKMYLEPDSQITFKSFAPREPFLVGGLSGLRVPFEASKDGVRLQGHLHCVRGPAHFHQFLSFGVPSIYSGKLPEVERMVQNAELVGTSP